MKNLSKVLFLALIVAPNAFAEIPSLECVVKDPCQHAKRTDLGYCVGNMYVRKEGGETKAIIFAQPKEIGQEIALIAAEMSVVAVKGKIVGSTNEGEDWIELQPVRGGYAGEIALEEDFGFSVVCRESKR